MPFQLSDALVNPVAVALSTASASVYTTGIDTGNYTVGPGENGDVLFEGEFLISGPVLNTTQLPDTRTITYNVQASTESTFASPTYIYKTVLLQTGASSAGAAAATARFRLPTNCPEFIRVEAASGASVGASATTSSFTLKIQL